MVTYAVLSVLLNREHERYYYLNPICISICTANGQYICMYYIEIPLEITNESAITLVYYLAQQKSIISRVILQMG